MDSLTQIVLGAAVGELALGRKIGNRAMIWGAIGGTIPDLDVLANPFMSDIEAMAFHRGITHSIAFSLLAPLPFGFIVHRLYHSRFHKTKFYKYLITAIQVILLGAIVFGINAAFAEGGYPRWWLLFITVLAAFYFLFRLVKYYLFKDLEEPDTSLRDWYWLFFLAFFTHIWLDCHTAYGTQVFQPFSNFRAAFDNISVVDPLYTVPFMLCLIVASVKLRTAPARRWWTWAGVGISSAYMLWTIGVKVFVDHRFERALAHRGYEVVRARSTPTIFNSILWACTAEGKDHFYVGQYSLFDSDPNFHHINVIPKQDSLIATLGTSKDLATIRWFADDYLTAFPTDSVIYLCDLRYGGMGDTIRDQRDLVFYFTAKATPDGYVFGENRQPPEEPIGVLFRKLIQRIKGY